MRLPAAVRGLRDLYGAIVFRWQWRWRIPATARLELAGSYRIVGRTTLIHVRAAALRQLLDAG